MGDVLIRSWTSKESRSSVLRLWNLMFKHKRLLLIALLGMFFYNVFNALPAWYSKDVVDSLRSDSVPNLDRFALVGFGIMIIFSAKGVCYFVHNYLLGWIGQKMVCQMRENLYSSLHDMPFSFFINNRAGYLISHFNSDLMTLQNALRVGLAGPFRDIPMILIFLGILGYRSWQLLLISLVVIPLAMVLIYAFGRYNKHATGQRLEKFGKMNSILNETMNGIRVVKTFGMKAYECKRFNSINNEIMQKYMRTTMISSYSSPVLEILGAMAGSAIIMVGGYFIINQVITPGEFVSFLLAFFMINIPLKRLNGFNLNIQEGLAASQRVFALIDHPGYEKDHPQAKKATPIKESLHLKIDKFLHIGGKNFKLHDIDIKIPYGKIVALVGHSGSGKTTLVNMIPRFFEPQEGAVMIDGVDIRKYSYSSLRSQIAMVNQDVFLFNDTVLSNIAYGRIACPHEDIITAAKAAYAHDFIMALPEGYNTTIGEKGLQLSGGQRQRLCIARALVKNAPILILDEATSSLDTESEQEVQLAIKNLIKNRTTVVIAHRLSTIRQSDRIYVMSGGTVRESGNHFELLEKGGLYSRLHQIQFQDREKVGWVKRLRGKMRVSAPEVAVKRSAS